MRVLVQRVKDASVTVAGECVGAIDTGLLLLAGAGPGDTPEIVERMARKIAQLRIFSDEEGRFNHTLIDVSGGALVVSQFTLFADARKGRRPSFTGAAPPEIAEPLVDKFAEDLRAQGVAKVAGGRFGADMDVALTNWGPVTLWLDSQELGYGPEQKT